MASCKLVTVKSATWAKCDPCVDPHKTQTLGSPSAARCELWRKRALTLSTLPRADYKPRTMSTIQTVMALTAAAAVGTAYVLIHEHRRKLKGRKQKSDGTQGGGGGGAQRSRSNLISRDLLLAILAESATAAFQLIEQVRSAAPVPL